MEDKSIPKLPTAHVLHFRLYKINNQNNSNIYIIRAHTIFKEVQKHFLVVGEQLTLK